MINKKLLLLLSIIITIIIAIVGLAIYKNYVEKTNLEKVENFAKNFTIDFSTYEYKNPTEYNNKINLYVSEDYLSEFKDTFNLADVKHYDSNKVKNYSIYQSADITVEKFKDIENIYTAKITYKAKKISYPNKPTEFEYTNSLIITILKKNDILYINNLVFGGTS